VGKALGKELALLGTGILVLFECTNQLIGNQLSSCRQVTLDGELLTTHQPATGLVITDASLRD
jgi:hypothetical protein